LNDQFVHFTYLERQLTFVLTISRTSCCPHRVVEMKYLLNVKEVHHYYSSLPNLVVL